MCLHSDLISNLLRWDAIATVIMVSSGIVLVFIPCKMGIVLVLKIQEMVCALF